MSYDIKIWSINKAKFPDSLPEEESWNIKDGNAFLEKKDGQIVVNESTKVEDEDISEEVQPLLPGISYLTELNLEPTSAPESFKILLIKVSKAIAKDVIGIIEDPQDKSIMAPSGINRFVHPKRERDERFSIIEMSWWFGENLLAQEKILDKLIDYFENKLPEALPKRYGEYEPPQFKFENTGKEGLKKYLSEHIGQHAVWYPTKPVVGVNFSLLKDWGFSHKQGKQYFSVNHLSIGLDSSALNQPGWKEHLLGVFKDISLLLKPFYGDVRLLHNHIHHGGTYSSDHKSEEHPIAGSKWMGIPKVLGQAVVIGDPYLEYFPKLRDKGELIDSLCLISTQDWLSTKNINSIIGDVPKEIAQVKPHKLFMTFEESLNRAEEEFPPIFPFDKEAKK